MSCEKNIFKDSLSDSDGLVLLKPSQEPSYQQESLVRQKEQHETSLYRDRKGETSVEEGSKRNESKEEVSEILQPPQMQMRTSKVKRI